jgi:hypothetical protein
MAFAMKIELVFQNNLHYAAPHILILLACPWDLRVTGREVSSLDYYVGKSISH